MNESINQSDTTIVKMVRNGANHKNYNNDNKTLQLLLLLLQVE